MEDTDSLSALSPDWTIPTWRLQASVAGTRAASFLCCAQVASGLCSAWVLLSCDSVSLQVLSASSGDSLISNPVSFCHFCAHAFRLSFGFQQLSALAPNPTSFSHSWLNVAYFPEPWHRACTSQCAHTADLGASPGQGPRRSASPLTCSGSPELASRSL